MFNTNSGILAMTIPGWVGLWLWIVIRLAGLFMLAPLFSHSAVFAKLRVLLILVLASCLLPMVQGQLMEPQASLSGTWVQSPLAAWRVADIVPGLFNEMLFGLLLGIATSVPLAGLQMAGQLIDQQMGVSIGEIYNPDFDANVSITGHALSLAGVFVFVQMGGVEQMLLLVAMSYTFIGPGEMIAWSHAASVASGLLQWSGELALRLAMPLLGLIFLESLAMGFMARTVPQINVLTIGFTLRIITGFGLMVLSVNDIVQFIRESFGEAVGVLYDWLPMAAVGGG